MPLDLWTSREFAAEVTSWVRSVAEPAGELITGEVEQPHLRPWSSTIRFQTASGALWFKVNGPGTLFEPALLVVLAQRAPDLVPDVLAVDPARGWTLMRDAGPVMRSLAGPDELWDRWSDVLGRYAGGQLQLAADADALRSTGTGWLPPGEMPGRLRQLVDELRRTPVRAGGLTAEEATRLDQVLPSYDAWCAELETSGVPLSVNHDDLHSSNICWGRAGPRIVDWGDATVTHPFATMLVTLNSIAWHAGTSIDDPRVHRVRDAYLEPFGAYGEHADRVRWVGLARRTGALGRALAYMSALEGEPPSAHSELDWPVRGWLLELLDA